MTLLTAKHIDQSPFRESSHKRLILVPLSALRSLAFTLRLLSANELCVKKKVSLSSPTSTKTLTALSPSFALPLFSPKSLNDVPSLKNSPALLRLALKLFFRIAVRFFPFRIRHLEFCVVFTRLQYFKLFFHYNHCLFLNKQSTPLDRSSAPLSAPRKRQEIQSRP